MLFISKIFNKDDRGFHSLVRILGAAKQRMKTTLSCICIDKNGYRATVDVTLRQNKEHWNLPFSSYYFNCLMRGNFKPDKVYFLYIISLKINESKNGDLICQSNVLDNQINNRSLFKYKVNPMKILSG